MTVLCCRKDDARVIGDLQIAVGLDALRDQAASLRCRRDMFMQQCSNARDERSKAELLELIALAGRYIARIDAAIEAEEYVIDSTRDWAA